MKLLLESLSIFVMVTFHRIQGEKRTCHMVSLEIEKGLTGYCCILVKNNSENDIKVEEIKDQLLDHLTNDTIDEVFNKNFENEGSTKVKHVNNKLSATDNDKIANDTSHSKKTNDTMTEDDHLEEYKNKLVSEALTDDDKNGTSSEVNTTVDDEKDAQNETVTVIPVNRNAVDIPETCPEGKEKDHNGECVPVF